MLLLGIYSCQWIHKPPPSWCHSKRLLGLNPQTEAWSWSLCVLASLRVIRLPTCIWGVVDLADLSWLLVWTLSLNVDPAAWTGSKTDFHDINMSYLPVTQQNLFEQKVFWQGQFDLFLLRDKHFGLHKLVHMTSFGMINVTQGLLVIDDKHFVWQRWDCVSEKKSWLVESRAPRELHQQLPAVLIITLSFDDKT